MDGEIRQAPARVAVVTGGHAYDVPGFHELFRDLDGVEPYIQHLDDFSSSPEDVRDGYSAVVFYFMPVTAPADDGREWFQGKPLTAMRRLGETPQGVVLLHHSLVAFRDWPVWAEISGVKWGEFDYHIGEKVPVAIARADHPVTKGMKDFEIVDETYEMADAGPKSEVLLTTTHPKSMKTLAWTRKFDGSRVFCLQLGHDARAWENRCFREVLRRGILWSANRL